MNVRRWLTLRLVAFGTPALVGSVCLATADTDANPYAHTIVSRNAFGLKTPPPPPNPEDLVKKDPPPKILLQGLTTILGRRQVLYKVQVPAKPGQQAKEESFVAAEGERNGEIEVVEIDEVAGVVKFNNHGLNESLNMKEHVAKAVGGTPPAMPLAQPGVVAPAIPGLPRPTAMVNPTPTAGSSVTTIGAATQTAGSVTPTIPTRTLRTASGAIGGLPGVTGHEQAIPQLDPEATAVLYEANRVNNEGRFRPKMPEHPLFSGAIKRLQEQQRQNEAPVNPTQP